MRKEVATPISAVLGLALLGSGGAHAKVVTVGSPLTGSFTQQRFSDPLTLLNLKLPESGAHVTSPVTGMIARWRITDASGGPFRLRVLTRVSGNTYRGTGTSDPQTPASLTTQTYPVSLPIAAGQTIGIDNTGSADMLGGAKVPGSSLAFWIPPLADGATSPAAAGYSGTEVGFNADVATDTLGKLKRNPSTGTARLSVKVPGPGTLTLSGNGVLRQRPARAAAASRKVSGAATVRLLVKAKGKRKKTLNKTGNVKVKVKVNYTPSGGLPGVPNTQTKRVKLVKKLG